MTDLQYCVGKAIYFRKFPIGDKPAGMADFYFKSAPQYDSAMELADVAISEIMLRLASPTQEMLDAGFRTFKCVGADDVMQSVWRAMLAALIHSQFKAMPQLEHT